jgi:flagellin
MSSINTNVSAMQALQSLSQTNQALETTQQRISTGYKVGDAKDNAAIWSVAQVMRSDVSGFGAISEQLSLGESTVAVARNASETVSDLVGQIKERVISAQGDNVDAQKIQNDIDELVGQVQSVVDAAQFNGTNLLKDGSGGSFDVLSSLDRDSSQNVSASEIAVTKQNLSTEADATASEAVTGMTASGIAAGVYTGVLTEAAADYQAGNLKTISVTYSNAAGELTTETANVGGDATGDVQTAIQGLAGGDFSASTFDGQTLTLDGSAGTLTVEAVSFSGNEVGLGQLAAVDVTTDAGKENALAAMEGFTQQAIDAASNFGSAQMRIETQMNFVSKLSDSLEAGVGSLVDANMTEESAKLNALQVQQQLGTQALSIANQSPQNLLSLFR